jgi:hypothetical protein
MTCPAAIIRRYETREQLQEYLARETSGAVDLGGVRIEARDGAAITDLANTEIVGIEDAEVVPVDAA